MPIGLKMPPSLLARIDAAAAALSLSRTAWIRSTLVQHLNATDKGEAP